MIDSAPSNGIIVSHLQMAKKKYIYKWISVAISTFAIIEEIALGAAVMSLLKNEKEDYYSQFAG